MGRELATWDGGQEGAFVPNTAFDDMPLTIFGFETAGARCWSRCWARYACNNCIRHAHISPDDVRQLQLSTGGDTWSRRVGHDSIRDPPLSPDDTLQPLVLRHRVNLREDFPGLENS